MLTLEQFKEQYGWWIEETLLHGGCDCCADCWDIMRTSKCTEGGSGYVSHSASDEDINLFYSLVNN